MSRLRIIRFASALKNGAQSAAVRKIHIKKGDLLNSVRELFSNCRKPCLGKTARWRLRDFMFVILWEFQVKPGFENEFVACVRHRWRLGAPISTISNTYRDTRLSRDCDRARWFYTLDTWESRQELRRLFASSIPLSIHELDQALRRNRRCRKISSVPSQKQIVFAHNPRATCISRVITIARDQFCDSFQRQIRPHQFSAVGHPAAMSASAAR